MASLVSPVPWLLSLSHQGAGAPPREPAVSMLDAVDAVVRTLAMLV